MKYAQLDAQWEAPASLGFNSCCAETLADSFGMDFVWFTGLGGGFWGLILSALPLGAPRHRGCCGELHLHPIPIPNPLPAPRPPSSIVPAHAHAEERELCVLLCEHAGFSFLKRLYLQPTMISFALLSLKILSILLH